MQNDLFELFGEPISTYTDAEAVEDGMLVSFGAHRATSAAFEWIAEHASPERPVTNWPVDLMAFMRATTGREAAVAMVGALLATEEGVATRIWEAGGALIRWPELDAAGEIVTLHETEPAGWEGRVLWFIPNELGGITLMFPEEY